MASSSADVVVGRTYTDVLQQSSLHSDRWMRSIAVSRGLDIINYDLSIMCISPAEVLVFLQHISGDGSVFRCCLDRRTLLQLADASLVFNPNAEAALVEVMDLIHDPVCKFFATSVASDTAKLTVRMELEKEGLRTTLDFHRCDTAGEVAPLLHFQTQLLRDAVTELKSRGATAGLVSFPLALSVVTSSGSDGANASTARSSSSADHHSIQEAGAATAAAAPIYPVLAGGQASLGAGVKRKKTQLR